MNKGKFLKTMQSNLWEDLASNLWSECYYHTNNGLLCKIDLEFDKVYEREDINK